MKIREITVGALPDFIQSLEYKNLHPKPITPARAISQFKNPHAVKDDVALVFVAGNDDMLLAFAGLLPHKITGSGKRIFSNSGWWVHPQYGRKFGLPVFLHALRICRQRMFVADATAHTQSILEKTGLFTCCPPVKGSRFFLRFYSGEWLRKNKKSRFFSYLFSVLDKILNALISLRVSSQLKKNVAEKYSINSRSIIDDGLAEFIKKHPGDSCLMQDTAKLNWIVQNPWVTWTKEGPPLSYPFTYRVESFRQEFLEVKMGSETVALLLLSIRDKHASIPFIYYKKGVLNDVACILWNHLARIKSNSLVVFHQELRMALEKSGKIWLFRKNITRFAGYSKELNPIFAEKKFSFQDGEGDVVFT